MAPDKTNLRDQLRVPITASIVMLMLAVIGRWPYGSYHLLRLVVCGASLYAAVTLQPPAAATS
jgi:hypothetical protein